MSAEKKLPDGWEVKRLGEVCDTGAGGTPLKSHKDYYENGTIPWLLSGEISQGDIFKAKNYITEKGLTNSSAKIFPKDTVLVAMYGATAGQVGILHFDSATNQAVCGILPNERYIAKYLYYFFLSSKDELIAQAVGGAQPNISQEKIRNTLIPVISLSEQKRIVAILDEAFQAIDRAKKNAEKNLANAREAFDGYLNQVFSNPGKDWEEKKLEDVSSIINGYAFASNDFKPQNVLKSVKITNVGVNEFIEDDGNNLPEQYLETHKEFSVHAGNILIALTRTIIANGLKVAIVPTSYDGALLNQRVAAIIPQEQFMTNKYLYYFFSSKRMYRYVQEHVNTLMQPNLSIIDLREVAIPVPSLLFQNQVIETLDTLSAETHRLELVYQKKLAALDELKKSILQKAFSGEL